MHDCVTYLSLGDISLSILISIYSHLFLLLQVSVTVRDKHVQGSPFKVNVSSGVDTFVRFGRKGSDIGEFNGIFGVSVDDENRIIVTDCHNHRVQVFNSQGGFMFQFGRKGDGAGQFQCPTGVGIDPEGRIIVCERLSSRIQVSTRIRF